MNNRRSELQLQTCYLLLLLQLLSLRVQRNLHIKALTLNVKLESNSPCKKRVKVVFVSHLRPN